MALLSSSIVAFLVCLMELTIVCCWQDTLFGVTVHFEERSGRITVSNENNSISIMFNEIAELAKDGRTEVGKNSQLKHKFKLFDHQVFESDGPVHYVDVYSTKEQENITVYRKNFTTLLNGPAATFNVEIWIFGNTTIIQSNPLEQYQVYNGTVKFAFSIDNWRFCGYNDTECVRGPQQRIVEYGEFLDIYASYSGGAKEGEAPKWLGRKRAGSKVPHRHPITYDYGGAEVTSSQVYMWNYTWESMARGYPKQVQKVDHNYILQHYEVFRFPEFFSPVYYEAFVDLAKDTYISNARNMDSCCLAVIVLSTLTFLFTWYIH